MYSKHSKIPVVILSAIAQVDILQCLAVNRDGTITAAGEACLGFSDTGAAAGEEVAIDVVGTSIATAGATIAADQRLEVGAGGKLIPVNTGKVVARALTDASGDGKLFEVLLLPSNA